MLEKLSSVVLASLKAGSFLLRILRVSGLLSGSLVAQDKHDGSNQNHGQGENLTHGDRSQDKAQVLIRFTEQFDDQSAEAVAGDEAPEYRPRRGRASIDPP